MQKILLYYKFMPVKDPEAIRLWQRALCESLNLKGRILIADHGINGTVGGDIEDLKKYVKATKQYFKGIAFKWSEGCREDFPKLAIRVRSEIVGFGAPSEVEINERGVVGGGVHLKPEQVHQLVAEHGDDVIFFDGRNAVEAEIGKFKNAIIPNTDTSKDFIAELESDKYDDIKDKPIVTYCTGGVRCEVISAMMKKRGFKEVYQIDGGIVKYGEKYKDAGLWEGKLYVFDRRMVTQFSEKAEDIGHCIHCDARTSNFINCANMACNNLVVVCKGCAAINTMCNDACRDIVAGEPALATA